MPPSAKSGMSGDFLTGKKNSTQKHLWPNRLPNTQLKSHPRGPRVRPNERTTRWSMLDAGVLLIQICNFFLPDSWSIFHAPSALFEPSKDWHFKPLIHHHSLSSRSTIFKWDPLRLVQRVENLEHLLNEEATDINEMLKVISNIQTGKEGIDIKSMKKRYMWLESQEVMLLHKCEDVSLLVKWRDAFNEDLDINFFLSPLIPRVTPPCAFQSAIPLISINLCHPFQPSCTLKYNHKIQILILVNGDPPESASATSGGVDLQIW